MAAEVKILVQGYTNANEVGETGDERTCATVTLVKDKDLIMVVDPGVLENRQILIDALQKENLSVENVNMVCITHSHIDHYRNIGMFPNAKILECFGIWEKDSVKDWQENFNLNTQIIRTPGHDNTGITILVTTGPDSEYPGVVAICGDVFWKENYPEDPHDDAFASNPEKLEQSRELILRIADWIIPGHSGIYKVNRSEFLREEKSPGGAKKKEPVNFAICKKCKRLIKTKYDSCRCRPYLCYHCCECGIDCDLCNCSHREQS